MNPVISAALGDRPFDLVLKNANFVNVFTEEIYRADIGVADGRVAHVTQPNEPGLSGPNEYDCAGKYALPGLIDTHVHIESAMMTPANFARAVIPHGTTTILADPHEFCNVLGVEGMRYCAEASRGIRLRVRLAAPSCVPAVLGLENNKATFGAPEVEEMLAIPECLALGEVMDYVGVMKQDARLAAILAAAKKRGMIIQGHVIGVDSRQLSAYMAAGCESDHESRELDEVLMKLRSGMVVECRYGSSAKNLPLEAKALAMLHYPVNAVLCTDDREPADLLREGHIDEAVRQAVAAGVPPVKAIQLATRNAALFLGLKDRGGLRPGSLADIVVADSLEKFSVHAVFIGGELCAEKGRLLADIAAPETEVERRNTMRVKREPEARDFRIAAAGDRVKLNCLSCRDGDPFKTWLKAVEFKVQDGFADIGSVPGFSTLTVIERHNATGNLALAPVEGIGLARGAVAGTVAHDSHNLFVFGTNAEDMAAAARHLIRSGGGFAAYDKGKLLAEIRLPVAGLVSRLPAADIAAEMTAMDKAVRSLGVDNHSPVHFLSWFCLPVLPDVRLTDLGLVDTLAQRLVPLRA